jgi:methyl-accepting chemotaxis protein
MTEKQCPTQFAVAVKEAGDQFSNILTDDELLNLSDPAKNIDEKTLSDVTEELNKKASQQRVTKPPATVTGDMFANKYPKLNERLSVGPISTAEVAIFATETGAALSGGLPGQVSLDMSNWTPGAQIPADIDLTLGLMSDFFDENMGASLSSGQCAAFALKVALIGGLLQALKKKADSLGDMPGFNLDGIPTIDEILEQLKSKLALEGIKKSLEDAIDKVVEKVKKQGQSITAGLEEISADIQQAVDKVNAFTSDKNKNGMMDGVEKMIANIGSGFDKLDAKALGLLMFRLCQVSEAIQSSSEKPLQQLILTASAVEQTKASAKNISARASQDAVSKGATRMDPADVESKKEEYTNTQRNLSSNVHDLVANQMLQYGELQDGVGMSNEFAYDDIKEFEINVYSTYPKVYKAKHLPKDEQKYVKQLQTDTSITGGVGPIIFTGANHPGIQTPFDKAGRDTGAAGPGWTKTKTKLWCQALDMARQLGTDIKVNRAFIFDGKHKSKRKGDNIRIEFDEGVENALAYGIAASRAGVKFIYIDKDSIVISNMKRGGALGKKLEADKDNAIASTAAKSDARLEALNSIYYDAVSGVIGRHESDLWQYYYAVKQPT